MRSPADLVLPFAYASGGLFWGWITGHWYGVGVVGMGYLSVFVITSFMVRRALKPEEER